MAVSESFIADKILLKLPFEFWWSTTFSCCTHFKSSYFKQKFDETLSLSLNAVFLLFLYYTLLFVFNNNICIEIKKEVTECNLKTTVRLGLLNLTSASTLVTLPKNISMLTCKQKQTNKPKHVNIKIKTAIVYLKEQKQVFCKTIWTLNYQSCEEIKIFSVLQPV